MCRRSLGVLAKVLFVPALLLMLAGCGANSTTSTKNQSGGMCSGCLFVYATTNADQILTFKPGSSGALGTPAITQGGANSPYLMAPLGGVTLYVSDPNNNAIDAFAVNSSDGTLTTIMGSPFSLGAAPGSPAGLLQFGNCLYVGDKNGTIAAFNIAFSGALTLAPVSPLTAGVAPVNLVSYNPYNINTVYAADFTGGGIWGFTFNSDCALTPVSGSPFATPPSSAPGAIAVNWTTIYVVLSGLNECAGINRRGGADERAVR